MDEEPITPDKTVDYLIITSSLSHVYSVQVMNTSLMIRPESSWE
jgi:hypothetical protein